MKLTLTKLQKLELQGVARDLLSQQHYLQAMTTFDSSNMPLEAQLSHGLIKLTEMVKGNQYNAGLKRTLEVTVNELQAIKPEFNIDNEVIPLLKEQTQKDIQNYQDIIDFGDQSQTYKANIKQRSDALHNVITQMDLIL